MVRMLKCPALMVSHAQLLLVDSWYFNLFRFQQAGDLIRSESIQRQLVDPTDDRCRFFIDQPLIVIILVFNISVRRATCHILSGTAFCLEHGLYLLAGILRIPFIHDVPEGKEVIVTLQTVMIVIDGDQADALLRSIS